MLPLGQSSDTGAAFLWTLVLIVFLLILFAAVVLLKRWLKADDDSGPAGPGFTLSDLRQLVADGKMTQEEFDKAKVAVVGSTKAAAAKIPPSSPTNLPRKS